MFALTLIMLCNKICKPKRGLSRHTNSQHDNQNKSNEIMKHPSKEMLQTSMPKLISEVAEALSMNKCYRQNIHEIFYNYKNAVNV